MTGADPRSFVPADLAGSEGEGARPREQAASVNRARHFVALVLPGAVAFCLVGLAWQLVALHSGDVVPRLGAIWHALATDPGPGVFAKNAAATLQETAVGLGASLAIAFSLAVIMVHIRIVERAVMPLAVVLNVTPIVSLAPGLSLVLGLGIAPRYLVTGIIVFFPLLVNSLVGLRSIDPEALDFLRSLAATRREVLVRLRLPSSLPFLFAAARISFPLAIVGAVVAEFSTTGSLTGLGSLIQTAVSTSQYPELYAAIVCLALLGLVLTLAVVVAERALMSWHPMRRGL